MSDDLEIADTPDDRGVSAPTEAAHLPGFTEKAKVGDTIEIELRRGDGSVEKETVQSGGAKDLYEPLGVVTPGTTGGWAQLANFSLGLGESTHFNDVASAMVAEIQEANGLEPTGDVRGVTWAYILPCGAPEQIGGAAAIILRTLLHLRPSAAASSVEDALASRGYEGSIVDADVWALLITERIAEIGGVV